MSTTYTAVLLYGVEVTDKYKEEEAEELVKNYPGLEVCWLGDGRVGDLKIFVCSMIEQVDEYDVFKLVKQTKGQDFNNLINKLIRVEQLARKLNLPSPEYFIGIRAC